MFVHDLSSEDGRTSLVKELKQRLNEDEFLMTDARKLDNMASLHFNKEKLEKFWKNNRTIQEKICSILNVDFVESQKISLKNEKQLWEYLQSTKEFQEVCNHTDLQSQIGQFAPGNESKLLQLFVDYSNTVFPQNRLLSLQNEISDQDYSLLNALSSLPDSGDLSLDVSNDNLSPTLDEENRMLDLIQYNFSRSQNLQSHADFLNKFASLRSLFARKNGRVVPIPSLWLGEMKKLQWPALKWDDLERIRSKKRIEIAEKLLN